MTTNIETIRKQIKYYWVTKGKAEKGLTQVKAAKLLNISQAAFSYYLSGKNPSSKTGAMNIGTDFIRAFAAMVGVKPSDINPELKDVDTVISGLKSSWVSVRFKLSGAKELNRQINVYFPEVPKDVFGVEVDIAGHNLIKKGQFVVCDPGVKPQEDDMVFVKTDEGSYIGELSLNAEGWVVVYGLSGDNYTKVIPQTADVFFIMSIHNERRSNAVELSLVS